MANLQDAYDIIHIYTGGRDNWRPGIVDLLVYSYMIDMYEDDMSDDNSGITWSRTPDEVMDETIKNGYLFDSGLEFGSEQLWEEVREYLSTKGFITNSDEQ
jgi:hypothetical protein